MGSLKRVQLNAPSLPSMWGCSGKVLNTMIYSLKRCWVNITPQPIFHSSNIFYFFTLRTKDYRMRTSVIPDSFLKTIVVFYFLPLVVCLLSLPGPHTTHQTLPGFGSRVIRSYRLKDRVNDLNWIGGQTDFPQVCSGINPQGTEHRDSID